MQKWEYLIVSYQRDGHQKPRYLNSIELKDWRKQTINVPAHFNQLGEQGWELVNYERLENSSMAVFKRPKP